jgi:hypothetical protein
MLLFQTEEDVYLRKQVAQYMADTFCINRNLCPGPFNYEISFFDIPGLTLSSIICK